MKPDNGGSGCDSTGAKTAEWEPRFNRFDPLCSHWRRSTGVKLWFWAQWCWVETWTAPQRRHGQNLAVIVSQNCSLVLARDNALDGIAALRRRGDQEAMMAEF